jgi:hypothetical protein
MRHQVHSEFGGVEIPLELVTLPASGGAQTVITAARGARNPHFAANSDRIYLYDEEGLFSIKLDGSDRREELVITGPRGISMQEEPPKAEMVKISPDGKHALAFAIKQVWVLPIAQSGGKAPTVDVRKPALPVAQLTDIGADFFGWSHDGSTVYWAIGNTFYERPFDSIELRQDDEDKRSIKKHAVRLHAVARRKCHYDGGPIDG